MGDESMTYDERLEFLSRRSGVPLTKEIREAEDPDLAILNKIHCYVQDRKPKPIVRFTDDPLHPILRLGVSQLGMIYAGLTRVVEWKQDGTPKKRIPLHKWWLAHPDRRGEEYV